MRFFFLFHFIYLHSKKSTKEESMKKLLLLVFVVVLSKPFIAQTVYYNVAPAAGSYLGDSTLKETATDLAYLFNKALGVSTFSVAALPTTTVSVGIVLQIDTNLLTTQRLQYCSAIGNGTTKIAFVASSSYGVRYGAYTYLAELGFKFYGSDSTWQIIPALTTPYKTINKIYQTKFLYHSFTAVGDYAGSILDITGTETTKPWHLYKARNNMVHEYEASGQYGEGWINDSLLSADSCYIAEYNGHHKLQFSTPIHKTG